MRTRAELFFTMEYSKQPLDFSELLQMLSRRGLTIADQSAAIASMEHISYFRLAAYLRPMEEDKITHKYKANASFEKALLLYQFDSELRQLLFGAVQEIEISLRSKMIHYFSLAYGPMWFFDANCCEDKHKFVENMSTIERELERSKEDFITEHRLKYGKEGFPPSWKVLELVSLGCLTKLFFNFNDNKVKKQIARSYGLPQHEILESWMKSINALRNACAHHARVWNRVMPVMPQLPNNVKGNWLTVLPAVNNKLYPVVCCIAYWIQQINSQSLFPKNLQNLIQRYPNVDCAAMGFPEGWKDEPLWKVEE